MTDLEPSARSWVRREPTTLLGIAVLTALVLVLAVMLSNRIEPADDRPRAAIGEVVIGPAYDEDGTKTTEIVLPWARLDASVSEPLQELPRYSEDLRAQLRPPAGGSFIQVSLEPDEKLPLASTSAPFVGRAEAVLTADGRDYPLTTAGLHLDADWTLLDVGGTVWVAVAGQPTEVSLSITVDGVTQVLADGEVSGGRADEFANTPTGNEIASMRAVECGPPTNTLTDGLTIRGLDYTRCYRNFVFRTPYIDRLGWAKEGRVFLVVQLRTDMTALSLGDDSDAWWTKRQDGFELTLDGEPSLAAAASESVPRGIGLLTLPHEFQYIFDVPSDQQARDLELTYTLDMTPANPSTVDPRHVELHWRLPAEAPTRGAR